MNEESQRKPESSRSRRSEDKHVPRRSDRDFRGRNSRSTGGSRGEKSSHHRGHSRDTISPARQVAFDVLQAVTTSDAYANLLLPHRVSRAGLTTQDSALATELTYGTLRRLGFYDRVIEAASGRKTDSIDAGALDALRLGTHQLLDMRVPAHAAVNESVSLARQAGSRSAAGFCNAVLRRVTQSSLAEWEETLLADASREDERLCIRYAHPEWIVRAFRTALGGGGHAAELVDLLAANNVAPKVNLARMPGLTGGEALPGGGELVVHADKYSPVGFVLERGDPQKMAGFSEGIVRVQDEGSQIAALALSRAKEATPGESWVDFCAGPGGKAALLAAEARAAGAHFFANELVPARADLVRRALEPLGDVSVWERDARDIGYKDPETFDRILLDAPCTGLGSLRRRPEARWRKTPRDVANLTALQGKLLDSALRALKPGGLVAYVTCSPHVAETSGVVDRAVRRWGSAVEVLDTPEILDRICVIPPRAAGHRGAQLWPHVHGTDAMYIALLEKR